MSYFSLKLEATEQERDQLIAELLDAGTTGITEDEDWLRAFFEDSVDSQELLDRFSPYNPHLHREQEEDWIQYMKDQWQPFPVGDRFFLVPEWRDDPAPGQRLRLRMYPGRACGTGTHPTTQLCLQALERHLLEGHSMLDVGTGSGILAEGARLLGADPVWACDIDHESTLIARQNLSKSPFPVLLFTGSVRSVRSESVDVVAANLNIATLSTIKSDLIRILHEHGILVLSGFQENEESKIISLFGKEARERLETDGWVCLVF